MLRVLSLAAALILAGCTTVPSGTTAPPPMVAGIGQVVLGYTFIRDVPTRVQDDFFTTFGDQAFLRHIPFANGVGDGSVLIRGYLSVIGNPAGTLLVYVFDFEDRAGNRLLRVGGERASPSAPADPWAAINYDLIRGVVGTVMDAFERWLADNRLLA